MKIPSIARIPKHQKFNYAPRFYDPIKEDIAQRREIIKRGLDKNLPLDHQSAIQNAFSRRRTANKKANLTQLLMIILLLATFFGYIYYGNLVLYLALAFVSVYLLVRKKKIFRKS